MCTRKVACTCTSNRMYRVHNGRNLLDSGNSPSFPSLCTPVHTTHSIFSLQKHMNPGTVRDQRLLPDTHTCRKFCMGLALLCCSQLYIEVRIKRGTAHSLLNWSQSESLARQGHQSDPRKQMTHILQLLQEQLRSTVQRGNKNTKSEH